MESVEVAIVGGGIGGLTLARALRGSGIEARVYERVSRFGPVGAGIQIVISAVADYVVTMRKAGDNPEPIAGAFDHYYGNGPVPAVDPAIVHDTIDTGHVAGSYSVQVWQRYAEPVWMDIAQSDVLSGARSPVQS